MVQIMDFNQFLANLLELLSENNIVLFGAVGGSLLGYLITSIFLSRIFHKASQPRIAAFVPLWNVITFYRLGGYSPLWIIGLIVSYAYILFAVITSAALLNNAEWVNSDLAKMILGTIPIALPIASFLSFATTIVGILAAYNIGRAFDKDAGYLLLFLLAYPLWTIILSFTSYDWDEDSANPNSIGEMDRTKLRAQRAREDAISKAKAKEFLQPGKPSAPSADIFESDYDRAVREDAERKATLPSAQKKKPRRKGKTNPGDARIVDSGSTGANTQDSTWFG